MRLLPLIASVALLGGAWQAQPPSPAPSPVELARQVQAHYDKAQDFSADFTVTYQGALLRQKAVEKGNVRLKKPNRMWWKYTAPDKREYVADGTRFYSYSPQDKLGTQGPLADVSDSSTFLLFLAGKGNLVRDFTPELATVQPADQWHLRLTPKTKQADYETLTLMVDRRTLDLRGLAQQSASGTHTFTFTGFRSNIGLKDSDFVFRFPANAVIKK